MSLTDDFLKAMQKRVPGKKSTATTKGADSFTTEYLTSMRKLKQIELQKTTGADDFTTEFLTSLQKLQAQEKQKKNSVSDRITVGDIAPVGSSNRITAGDIAPVVGAKFNEVIDNTNKRFLGAPLRSDLVAPVSLTQQQKLQQGAAAVWATQTGAKVNPWMMANANANYAKDQLTKTEEEYDAFLKANQNSSTPPVNLPEAVKLREKAEGLDSVVAYWENQRDLNEDQTVTQKNLDEISGWSAEEQAAMDAYVNAKIARDSSSNIFRYFEQQKIVEQNGKLLEEKVGAARLKELAESYERSLSAQATQQIKELGEKHATGFLGKTAASAATVGTSLIGNVTAPTGYLMEMMGGTGQYKTLDPNNLGNLPNVYSGAVRGKVAGDLEQKGTLGKVGSLAYQGGMSALDSLTRLAVAGETGALALAGVGSFGQAVSQASAQGASPEQALAMGVITAGLEVATEKVSLDNLLSKSNAGYQGGMQAVKDAFVQAGVEVSEEELSFIGSTLAEAAILREKSSYNQQIGELVANGMSYEDAKEQANRALVNEALQTAGVSAFSGGMMSGATSVVNKVSASQRNQTTLTENEQKVVDKVTSDRIAEQEQDGEKLTDKAKKQIREAVIRAMEDGSISTDTIEEVLGGETYKTYKDTIDSEDAIKREFDILNKMKQGEMTGEQIDRRAELKDQLETIKNEGKRDQLKSQLGEEVMVLTKGDRLSESYNEKRRRGQAFEADLSKYDAKQQKVIQKAVESGILNNTNRTHKFVDWIARVSADKDILFDFTNNKKLKESGFALDGKTVNGYVTKDGVTININSAKALNSVVGHEITHVLQGTEFYAELQKTLFDYAKAKGDYQGRLDSLTKLYEGVEGTDIEEELTADLVGDYLFTDADFVNRLSTENRNVFQQIYDEIKYLCKVVTAGSKEARQLEKVKKIFEKVYKESAKTPADTKYSIGEIIDKNNNSYGIGVYLDSTLLDNLTPDERKVMVKERIKELGGEVFTAYDSNGNAVNITIAKPGASFKNQNGKRRPVNKDLTTKYIGNEVKQEAVVLIDELIATSKFQGTDPAKHAHDWLDNNGQNDWDVWTTYIQDKNNTIWEATLHIANTANGEKVIYDVDPTKKVGQSGNSDTSLPNNTVAQEAPDVKYSLSNDGEQIAPYGDYNVSGKDIALDIAPVAENATVQEKTKLTEDNSTGMFPDDFPIRSDMFPDDFPIRSDMFPDDFPIREELDELYQQKKALENRMQEARNAGDEDALTDASNAYGAVTARIGYLQPENVESVKEMPDNVQTDGVESTAKSVSTRKELHQSIIDRVKSKFSEKGFDFDEVLKNAKNMSTFATVDNTPQRVMEKALGYKEGGILADETVNKVAQNESEGIRWLNSFTDRKNGLLAQISKQYNIKPRSKQSAAAQMYAEGFYVDEKNNIIRYGDAELAADFPDAKVRANIKGLAKDPRIRQIYDETLTAINESRKRNAYPEIPRLDNYFLHFRAMEDTFSRLGLPFNPNDIRAKDLPTDLNGVTADLKPGQPYFASAMHRTGIRTSFDLLGGIERYLTSAKNQIYHIDDIQTFRALRNYVADTYGQANGLEDLDALSEEEAQERIQQVYNSHMSTFAKFLNEEANVLAGKTALIDRGLEGIIGRRGITFLNTLNQQVGSNMVGYNVSSSLTNVLPVVQAFAKTNKFDFTKAFAQTVSNKIGSVFGRSDGFAENSPVIIRRKGAERFYRTVWQKIADPGYALMGAVDGISTELIARTKYNELTRKGMDSQQAHFETDKWVSKLMGDRSLGQMPQLYNSKMLGLVTKFQLEVRNQLDSQFYDTIQETKASNEHIQNALLRNAKTAAKVTSTFVQLAVVQHLFGKAFESLAGYNPAFDMIDVLIKACGFDDEEDSEDTVLDNIEEGFFALLEDMPYTSTFTGGGRIPISSALPIRELVMGEDENGNEKSRLETLGEVAPYYLMPGGYGQLKKTGKGLDMFSNEHPMAGSYSENDSLQFPIKKDAWNVVQAAIFGKWANENAREYFDGLEDDAFYDLKDELSEKAYADGATDKDIVMSKYLSSVNSDVWDLIEQQRDLPNSKLSDEEKYEKFYELQQRIDDLKKKGMDTYTDVSFEKFNGDNYARVGEYVYKKNDEGEWEALSDEQLTKYEVTKAAKGAYYATDGTNHYKYTVKDGYGTWYKISEDELKKQREVTKGLGISPEEYWRDKTEYTFAYNQPENYAVAKAVGGYDAYTKYSRDLYNIKADKDKNGKSISGSKQAKVLDYINNLDADYYTKLILYKSQYNSYDAQNDEILEYLNSRTDLTYQEKVSILKKLGADVDSEGRITW